MKNLYCTRASLSYYEEYRFVFLNNAAHGETPRDGDSARTKPDTCTGLNVSDALKLMGRLVQLDHSKENPVNAAKDYVMARILSKNPQVKIDFDKEILIDENHPSYAAQIRSAMLLNNLKENLFAGNSAVSFVVFEVAMSFPCSEDPEAMAIGMSSVVESLGKSTPGEYANYSDGKLLMPATVVLDKNNKILKIY